MRPAAKFMALLLLGVIGLLFIQSLMEIKRQVRCFDAGMRHDARLLGHA